jgi:hypothetical protein
LLLYRSKDLRSDGVTISSMFLVCGDVVGQRSRS